MILVGDIGLILTMEMILIANMNLPVKLIVKNVFLGVVAEN